MDAHLVPMEEAMDDGWASMMILRRDEECVRNANAPSCPLLEEGMSATCVGLDNGTARLGVMPTAMMDGLAAGYRHLSDALPLQAR